MDTTTATSAAAPRISDSRATAVIITLCFGSLAGALMQSLVIPIQSELPALLDTSAANASWAITATLLAGGVSMPVTGRLADMYGKKRVMVACAAILVVASLLCAVGTGLVPFLLGRALQGIAMGYIPVAISAVRALAPREKQATAVATVSATLGVGGAIGLPLSAWIAQTFDWHALFYVSTALAVVVLAATALVVPATGDTHPARLDLVGLALMAVGLVSLLVGISKGSTWGWGSGTTWACIVGGLVVLVIFGLFELRHHDPLVDVRTMGHRPVFFTNIAAVLIGFGMMASSIVVPQLLQMDERTGYGLGQTILQAGMWMFPGGLMMMVFAPISARLINAIGARLTLAIGAFVVACGYVFGAFMMDAPWKLMVSVIISSAGVGIGYAAFPTLIMDNVPLAEAGSSVGVNSLMRSVGTTTAGAVMAAVLTSKTMELGGFSIPSESAFQLCFFVGAGAAVAGALVALLVPARTRRSAGRPDTPEPGKVNA
ncbi:MFS transporter [Rhodococcus sp. Z13]|uniref:MFS transporter n=1 Tax=Rhodococcus sacchari TaxID=2962047 RepID=A0ACD4DBL2_9NOCA|nr:MDR family MFS transporter [Rhodococcus sp. Z13]UYP17359.1 MFS transporter [Rhodococcus sp. Z13]